MNFSEKLKEIRKNEGLSQEQLAEKIGVSRQAITKWETGKGLPDIENMMIIAEIFKTTLDELISSPVAKTSPAKQTYTSETLYDIDCEKHFDINIGSASNITLSSGCDEKLHICLQSDTQKNIGELFKIKLDEKKNKLDVDCVHKDKISRFEAEDSLSVEIILPTRYSDHCELNASAKYLEIKGLRLRRLEYDGDAQRIVISNSSGSLEFTSKTDYDITLDHIEGSLDVNQWKSKTIVHIPEKNLPNIQNKGRKCDVYFMKNNERCNPETPVESEDTLSISGIYSELIVDLI